MEKLKVAIADKILEVSSGDELQMKQRLLKIQRFGDFAEACKSLMVKYPQIEAELLEMALDNDFDTARASRRVDSVINKSHSTDIVSEASPENQFLTTPPSLVDENIEDEENATVNQPEQIDAAINTAPESQSEQPTIAEETVYIPFGEESHLDEEAMKKARQKKIFTLVWQVLLVALALVLIFLVVKFVINYWKYILIGLIGIALLFFLWRYFRRRKKE